MLKQHRELNMFVHRTIETNEEAEIRPSKTYQLFVAAARSHRELSFIEKDVKNYITRKIRNISEQDDAKEFGNSLRQFVKQYDNCLASREETERVFDAADFHIVILCATKSAIEAQFLHVYTHEKFMEVQAQFRGGILCRHSLSVLSFERIDNAALKYIMERWSKNIKRRHRHIKSSQYEPLLEPRSKRFDELVFRSYNICEFASEFEALTGILHRAFDKVMVEMQEYQERSKEKSLLSHKEATLSEVNDL
ncbi:hypothetical protein Ahy_B10g101182 [Arachis hypogaea]|uniref:Protein FAR1-RELATED SEQUENCE n=1 Tax=Arachis hypogaea TaxID=3818 RepID=A0A444WYU4_ARAHY|nr:hypothetical protein Ahy_B10g101182 [Arachis hypogaea]